MKNFLLCAMILSISGIASAQVTLTGPFVGASSEYFENLPNALSQSSVTVMGTLLTYTSASSNAVGAWNGGWGLGVKGGLTGREGAAIGAGNDGGTAPFTFTFATPVSSFGGIWQVAQLPNVVLDFYDSSNNLMGTDSFNPAGNVMTWRGWNSVVPIARIEFTQGESVAFDALQANPAAVPEPATMLALGAGVVAIVARRRRK